MQVGGKYLNLCTESELVEKNKENKAINQISIVRSLLTLN